MTGFDEKLKEWPLPSAASYRTTTLIGKIYKQQGDENQRLEIEIGLATKH